MPEATVAQVGGRSRWWLGALGLVLILVGVGTVMHRVARRGSFADPGSTYRASPDGARGLFLLAEGSGLPVNRVHTDLSVVEARGVMVMVGLPDIQSCDTDDEGGPMSLGLGGYSQALTSGECNAVLDWVSGGEGNLIYVTDRHDALVEAVGLELVRRDGMTGLVVPPDPSQADDSPDAPPPTEEGEEDLDELDDMNHLDELLQGKTKRGLLPPKDLAASALVPGQPTILATGVGEGFVPVEGWLESTRGDEVSVLVTEADLTTGPRTVAAAVPYGDGWIVVVSAPALATNAWLGRRDNAAFWLALFEDLVGSEGGMVHFDEYHHGNQSTRTLMGYAVDRGLLPALIQILFVVLIGTLAARRLGPLRPASRTVRKSSGDYLAAMSHLYQSGGHLEHASASIAERAYLVAEAHRGRAEVDAALGKLEKARMKARQIANRGGRPQRALHEVARAAAHVYDALTRRGRGGVDGRR